ncbi:MAG TPA: TetR-like C-terminal domain-containing protein [Actinomycetes bacterium]
MARKVGVTKAQVVDAAAVVADRDGLGAMTLATVAGTLGVKAPSLYAHVDGLGGLRRDLSLAASRQLGERMRDAAEAEHDPAAAMRAIGHAYRGFATEHPGLYACLLPVPRPDNDPDGAATAGEPVAVVAAVLADLGVPPAQHIDLIRSLRAMLHGFVDLENGGGFGLADPVDASFSAALDLVIGALTAQRPAGAS